MTGTPNQCHFCGISNERIIDETDTCLVMHDLYPVTPLHTLIITKRHIASYFDLNDQERQDVQMLIDKHQKRISEEDESVSGFNIGVNCGKDAGQTIMHCHVHLIPRRKGDIDDPRGGVRGVIPGKRIYDRLTTPAPSRWEKENTSTVKEIEEQSRKEYLDLLIKCFERVQTIQDVGTWLLNDTFDPLPPKHIAVLRKWLETHNELTIKQSRRGNPHSDIRNAFLYITRLHRDTGMSVEAAIKLVAEELNLEMDLANLRRMYDRARTPESRYACGAFRCGVALAVGDCRYITLRYAVTVIGLRYLCLTLHEKLRPTRF